MIDRGDFSLVARRSNDLPGNPVILLSNSLGASQVMWAPQLALLEQRYSVIIYDTRGHGASDAPEGPYSFADLVDDAAAVLDHYGVEQADFMGLSLGGMTGLGLALEYPERVGKLVCCDARADAPAGFVTGWDDRIAAIDAGGVEAILNGTMERWFTETFRTHAPDMLARMHAMFLETSATGYKGCAAALKQLDYLKDLGKLRLPVLYVVGTEDAGAPPDVMRAMCEATPGAKFAEVPDAAHIANVDNPAGFNAAISDFLNLDS